MVHTWYSINNHKIPNMYCVIGRDIHHRIYEDLDIHVLLELSLVNHYHNNIIKQIETYDTFIKLKKKLAVSKTFQSIRFMKVRKAYFIYKTLKYDNVNLYGPIIKKLDINESCLAFLLCIAITENIPSAAYMLLAKNNRRDFMIQMRYETMMLISHAVANDLSRKKIFIDIVHGRIPSDVYIPSFHKNIDMLLK